MGQVKDVHMGRSFPQILQPLRMTPCAVESCKGMIYSQERQSGWARERLVSAIRPSSKAAGHRGYSKNRDAAGPVGIEADGDILRLAGSQRAANEVHKRAAEVISIRVRYRTP